MRDVVRPALSRSMKQEVRYVEQGEIKVAAGFACAAFGGTRNECSDSAEICAVKAMPGNTDTVCSGVS